MDHRLRLLENENNSIMTRSWSCLVLLFVFAQLLTGTSRAAEKTTLRAPGVMEEQGAVSSLRHSLNAQLTDALDNRPYVVAPLVLTGLGLFFTMGPPFLHVLRGMGSCEPSTDCRRNRKIPTNFLVVSSVGASVAVVGALWAWRQVTLRRSSNADIRRLRTELQGLELESGTLVPLRRGALAQLQFRF